MRSSAESLLAGQNRALELIATDAPLREILELLTNLIEMHAPGLRCSIMLLVDGRLWQGAAPSLAADFCAAIEGAAIGPYVGSCGTAAFTRRCVIVTDVASDPLWADFRELALANGVRACWSTPIFGNGDVLGTFAMYYDEPRGPRRADLHLIEIATHIAGIAIDRHRAHQAARERAAELALAARKKDEFIALLAHELRNPLAPMALGLELIRRHEGSVAVVRKWRDILERQFYNLQRLVDDLLDVSRITQGKITIARERTTVGAVVERALEASLPIIEGRGHSIKLDLPAGLTPLDADPIRLSQVISNLLNNAAKCTDAGGHIVVRADRQGDDVYIRVRDDGRGIPEEMLDRIFEPFVQTGPSQGGLGLGLTLVRTLVELHGGSVEATSEGSGRGAEIVVRLPVAPVEAITATPAAKAGLEHRVGARRVLVVDDNVDAADSVAEVIRESGDDVVVAHDGPSAIAEAHSFCPSVVFLDIGLPGMDGYEVARRLRAEDSQHTLRLIALTGYGQEADRKRAKDAGFDAHLVKPASLEGITAAMTAPTERSL